MIDLNINFREVNKDNWEDCVDLRVNPEQKTFVKPNYYSLVQAHYENHWTARAIYDEDTLIGFVMYGVFEEEDDTQTTNESRKEGWICRYMIDKNFQGKGYGKAALIEIIAELENNLQCKQIGLSEVPGNHVAKKLYENLGFKLTGKLLGDQEVMVKVSQ